MEQSEDSEFRNGPVSTSGQVLKTFSEPAYRECVRCNRQFELPEFIIAAKFIRICPECAEKQAVEDQQTVLENAKNLKESRWKTLCPPEFHQTDLHKLPKPAAADRVMAWQYQARGLSLVGPTGRGKSRAAWMLLKREYNGGRSICALNSGCGFQYGRQFEQGVSQAAKWVDHRCLVDLLLLDDVLKVKLTDSMEQALFVIVNHRTEWQLPIIFTTQDTGETLISRASEDRGGALVRRLREYSLSINFA